MRLCAVAKNIGSGRLLLACPIRWKENNISVMQTCGHYYQPSVGLKGKNIWGKLQIIAHNCILNHSSLWGHQQVWSDFFSTIIPGDYCSSRHGAERQNANCHTQKPNEAPSPLTSKWHVRAQNSMNTKSWKTKAWMTIRSEAAAALRGEDRKPEKEGMKWRKLKKKMSDNRRGRKENKHKCVEWAPVWKVALLRVDSWWCRDEGG